MSTVIRPEVSKSNDYWIPRDRYYELQHFCLQYPYWVEFCREADSTSKVHLDKPLAKRIFSHSDPVMYAVELRERYFTYIDMVKTAADETDIFLSKYLLKDVTEKMSYTYLHCVMQMPCGRTQYYVLRRKYFWILDKLRK